MMKNTTSTIFRRWGAAYGDLSGRSIWETVLNKSGSLPRIFFILPPMRRRDDGWGVEALMRSSYYPGNRASRLATRPMLSSLLCKSRQSLSTLSPISVSFCQWKTTALCLVITDSTVSSEKSNGRPKTCSLSSLTVAVLFLPYKPGWPWEYICEWFSVKEKLEYLRACLRKPLSFICYSVKANRLVPLHLHGRGLRKGQLLFGVACPTFRLI